MTVLWAWLATMLLCVASAQEPEAEESPDIDLAEESELHFQLGAKDYSKGEFQEALSHFLRSYRLAPNRNTAFNIARVYDEVDRPDQAWRYYDISLRGETDPTLQAPALQAMSRLEPRIARVQVTSDPPGANVYVGSMDLGIRGITPVTLSLLPGRHDIVVALQGYSMMTVEREFPGNGLYDVEATLKREEAERRASALASQWVESQVTLEGEVIARVAPQNCEILPQRLAAVSAWREPVARMPGPVPGSALAAQEPMRYALDVVVEDLRARRTSRLPLSRDKRALYFQQASDLNAWVLDRCEITNGAAVADTLEDMPKKLRQGVVALLAELATGGDVATAAQACIQGTCEGFGALLRF